MELPAQGDGELLVHDLHDLLGGRDALHDLFGQRPRPHALEEVVGHLDGHVGLQQGGPDVAQGVVHLLGMELSPAAEFLENAVESVAQGVEHTNGVSPWPATTGLVYRAGEGRPCSGARVGCRPNDRRTRCAWSASSRTCDGSSPPSARSRWGSRSATGATTRGSRSRSRLPSSSASRSATSRSRTRSAGGSIRRSCVRSGSRRSCSTPSSCRGWCGSSRAAPRTRCG